MRAILVGAFLALSGGGALWNLQSFDRASEARRRYQPRVVALPRVEFMKVAALGYEHVLADWYYIAGVNYFGDQRNLQTAYAELANYLDLAVGLDPQFHPPYLFGAYALPWNRGDKWVNIAATVSLLKRGIEQFPYDWRLRFQLAYCYSAYFKQFKDAGDQLAAASKIPGAPVYLATLATRMYVTEGDVEGAELLAKTLYETSTDPKVRWLIRQRMAELKVAAEVRRLQAAVEAYRAEQGPLPGSLQQVVEAGLLTAVPVPALGGTYLYDAQTGEVSSSVLKDRLSIFIHPREDQITDAE